MVCCVLIVMVFMLPVMLVRKVYGVFGGVAECSMAWRADTTGGYSKPQVLMEMGPDAENATRFTDDHFSITGRVKSFGHAGRGAYSLLRHEHSAWIQLTLAAAAVVAGLALQISSEDWRWIVLMIGLVLSAEGMNTAIETTCNRISLEYSDQIKAAKDVASGAVLLISITAAVIGLQVLLPYLFSVDHGYLSVLDCIRPSGGFDAEGSNT